MERQPNPGNEHHGRRVNSYGTDDPAEQARIEEARSAAAHERRRDRQRLEHLVELGISPDDAETFIEFAHFVEGQLGVQQPGLAEQELPASDTAQENVDE